MIEQKLREYRSNLSKLKLTECSMKQLENEIQVLEPSYISAYAFSDTPPSKTNRISSVVENTVLEGENRREQVGKLKERLRDMAKERLYLQCKVEIVQALLVGMTDEERFVIEKYYFDGLAWHIVSEKYRREYGIYKTARTLKAKRYDALRKMNNNLQAARV